MTQSNWKWMRLAGILAGVWTLGGFTGISFAAEDMKAPAAAEGAAVQKTMSPQEQEMMKKMQEFMTPGENHRVLDALVGNWDFTIKSWMSVDAPPEESTGTSQIVWDLDGHFLKETVQGSMMGKPFSGLGYVGYDNLKKEYESIWLDNMST